MSINWSKGGGWCFAVFCKAPCCPPNEILYSSAQFFQCHYGRLFLTHKAMYQFTCTKQKAPDSCEIQMSVHRGMHVQFVHIVVLVIYFWNIWHEMSWISMSEDANGVCSVPNCCQQTVENFRDCFELLEFSWVLKVMPRSIVTLKGTIKEQNVLLTCFLSVNPAYIMPSHGNIHE